MRAEIWIRAILLPGLARGAMTPLCCVFPSFAVLAGGWVVRRGEGRCGGVAVWRCGEMAKMDVGGWKMSDGVEQVLEVDVVKLFVDPHLTIYELCELTQLS